MALFLISSSYSESNIGLESPKRQIASESSTLELSSPLSPFPAAVDSLKLEVEEGEELGCETLRKSGVGLRNVDVDLGVDILMEGSLSKFDSAWKQRSRTWSSI